MQDLPFFFSISFLLFLSSSTFPLSYLLVDTILAPEPLIFTLFCNILDSFIILCKIDLEDFERCSSIPWISIWWHCTFWSYNFHIWVDREVECLYLQLLKEDLWHCKHVNCRIFLFINSCPNHITKMKYNLWEQLLQTLQFVTLSVIKI